MGPVDDAHAAAGDPLAQVVPAGDRPVDGRLRLRPLRDRPAPLASLGRAGGPEAGWGCAIMGVRQWARVADESPLQYFSRLRPGQVFRWRRCGLGGVYRPHGRAGRADSAGRRAARRADGWQGIGCPPGTDPMRVRPPRLPGYVLGPRLGGGPTADVFAAADAAGGRGWAVKVLRDDAAADPTNVQLFRREARAGLAVRHPNLVRVVRAGLDGASGRSTW